MILILILLLLLKLFKILRLKNRLISSYVCFSVSFYPLADLLYPFMTDLFGYEVQDSSQTTRRSQERCSIDEQSYDLFSSANPCIVVVVPCDLPDFARIWSEFDSIVDFCDDHPDWGVGVLEEFRMAQKAVYRQYGAKRKW